MNELCRIAVTVAVIGTAGVVQAARTNLFYFNFPASSSDLGSANPSTVSDASTAGNDANAYNFSGTGLSTDVPAGMPATDRSIDFTTGGTGGNEVIQNKTTKLLNNTDIDSNGGFTFDVWLKINNAPASGVSSIIDYAGYTRLYIDDSGKIIMHFEGSTSFTGPTLTTGQWYHVETEFFSQNLSGGDLSGTCYLKVDGNIAAVGNTVKITGSKESERPIGIGRHPSIGQDGFDGYIYNPRVYLGVSDPHPPQEFVVNVDINNSAGSNYSGQGALASAGNLWTVTQAYPQVNNLPDSEGNPTTINIVRDGGTDFGHIGTNVNNLTSDYIYSTNSLQSLTIKGLNPNKTYDLYLYGCQDNIGGRGTTWTVGGVTKVSDADFSKLPAGEYYLEGTTHVVYLEQTPSAAGEIEVTAAPEVDGVSFMNGFQIRETPPKKGTLIILN
jgi:hypothetical protein